MIWKTFGSFYCLKSEKRLKVVEQNSTIVVTTLVTIVVTAGKASFVADELNGLNTTENDKLVSFACQNR